MTTLDADDLAAITRIVYGQRCIYVSKSGNDSNSGLTPTLAKLTIGNAALTSVAGEKIIVLDGTYDERNVLKDRVDIHFVSGSGVDYDGVGSGAIFDDVTAGTPLRCRVTGNGFIRNNGTGAIKDAIRINNTSSELYVEAQEIFGAGRALAVTTGFVLVKADRILSTSQSVNNTGGQLHVQSAEVYSSNDTCIDVSGDSHSQINAAYIHTIDATGVAVTIPSGGAGLQVNDAFIVGPGGTDGIVNAVSTTGVASFVNCYLNNLGESVTAKSSGTSLGFAGVVWDKSSSGTAPTDLSVSLSEMITAIKSDSDLGTTGLIADAATAATQATAAATQATTAATEIVSAIKADPDLGTTGLIADAATAAGFGTLVTNILIPNVSRNSEYNINLNIKETHSQSVLTKGDYSATDIYLVIMNTNEEEVLHVPNASLTKTTNSIAFTITSAVTTQHARHNYAIRRTADNFTLQKGAVVVEFAAFHTPT